jgi:hypothetical protein
MFIVVQLIMQEIMDCRISLLLNDERKLVNEWHGAYTDTLANADMRVC